MKNTNEVYDDVVNYDAIDNYTIKIFKNRKGEFYAHVVYEDDETSEMIYQSAKFSGCNLAKQDAMKHIEEIKK